jgi:carboxypeptidase C (cathepsin A)
MNSKINLIFILTLITTAQTAEPTLSDVFPEQPKTGYIEVKPGVKLFYWFFNSRTNPQTDPLVFWLNGGPGCASELGLFFENGPIMLKSKDANVTTIRNDAWNNRTNMVWLDNPAGAGFSIAEFAHRPRTKEDVREQFYTFLLKFLEMPDFKRFKGAPIYITGESFGGHWVPYIANKLYFSNNPDVNLQGVLIGSGWITTATVHKNYPDYAWMHKDKTHMDKAKYEKSKRWSKLCVSQINNPNPFYAWNTYDTCDNFYDFMVSDSKGNQLFNEYNLNMQGSAEYPYYDRDFLKRKDIQKLVGGEKEYEPFSGQVYFDFRKTDWFADAMPYLTPIVEGGIKVWFFNGELDWICNWFGDNDNVNQMDWEGRAKWNTLEWEECEYGHCKELANVRMIKFPNASHMVPHEQPVTSTMMINEMTHGK